MKAALTVFLSAAVLSVGQAPPKEDSQAPAKQDNWQRTKECADQAEKVMASKESQLPKDEYYSWSNHYSPKYGNCFIEIRHMLKIVGANAKHTGVVYTGQVSLVETELQNAFERAPLAYVFGGNLPEHERCNIGGDPVDCAKAINFIAEHMKN
jgi:hypothetical protein